MDIYAVLCILLFVAFVMLLCFMTHITSRLKNKEIDKLNKIKLNLEEKCGIKFNHSYKLISKKDKSIRYLRVFSIYVLGSEVKAKCYFTTKGGEIGVWDDKIEFLYTIKNNFDLEDCGEWDV